MRIPRGNNIVTNRQTSTGQVESGSTQQAVSMASSAMSLVSKWNDERDKSKTQEAINAAARKTNDWKVQNMSRTGKEAEGLTEEFLKFNKGLEDELGKDLSVNAKSSFSQWNLNNAENNRMNIMVHQKTQEEMVKKSAFNDGLSVASEMIRTDAKTGPQAFQHLNDTLELGLQSGVIKEEEFELKKTELNNGLRGELGKSYYTQDKHSFMKEINNFGFGKPEIEAYKSKYANDLAAEERERKSLFAEEAKLLYAQRDDMKVQATENEDTSHFYQGAEKLRKMGFNAQAEQLIEDGKTYDKVIEFNSSNKNKPLREMVTLAQGLSIDKKLDGSSMEFKANQAIRSEVQKQAKIFDADPAEYVSKWAHGGTLEEMVSSRLSLQGDQGLYPSKGYQALTAQEKSSFKGAWEAGDSVQRSNLILESFRYGKHTPQVLDEAGINSALTLAPIIGFDSVTGVNKRDVEMLVSGVSGKLELLDDTQKSEYRSSAKESELYQVLTKVQQKFPTNPDLPQRMADIEKATMGISAKMVNAGGGRDFMDQKIATLESGDKLIYFPKSMDEDEIESSLDSKKQEIISKFKTGDRIKDSSIKWAMRDATWVNTASGFILTDSRSGAFIEGSQVDMLELEPLKKDLSRKVVKDPQTVTFMRR